MIMLDTNICVYILKKHPIEVLEKFKQYKELYISAIVYSELQYGIELSPEKIKQNRLDQLLDFLSLLSIQAWDHKAAHCYASIRADLKARGLMIGNMDALIAAHALSLNATLITNNTKEFSRIPDLNLENWVT